MTPNLPHFYVARITLETKTPLPIAAGPADGVFDVALVRDANGLPTIPGSSFAGVLRHLCRAVYDEDIEKALFGWQENNKGEASRLHVSWGAIQDSKGRPVEGLLLGEARRRIRTDPLLRAAVDTADSPVFRDRVRISHRGAAADKGKFDRAVLPTGYRFSAEISLWNEQADDARWGQLLRLLKHPLFRLGGTTRAGLGKLFPVTVHVGHFDLTGESGRTAFAELPPSNR